MSIKKIGILRGNCPNMMNWRKNQKTKNTPIITFRRQETLERGFWAEPDFISLNIGVF